MLVAVHNCPRTMRPSCVRSISRRTLLAGRDYLNMRCYATKSDGSKGMTKTEFVKRVAEESSESIGHTEMMVNAVLKVLVRSVANGEKITLPGFGTFDARARGARKGRNPQTGAAIDIPAGTYPTFSASVKFKRIVKGEEPSP